MLLRRKMLLALAMLMVVGSLTATIAYAVHLHSRALRDRVAQDLSRRMGLGVEIRRVRPLSFSTRRFDGIKLYLPHHGTAVAEAERVVWRAEEQDDGKRCTLDITDGWLLVGSKDWDPQDYGRMLRSGFGHDFAALHIAEIGVHNIDFRWRHPQYSLTAPAAEGNITFDRRGRGRAALTIYQLNDTPVEEPVHLFAWFTPGPRLAFQKVELRAGDIPLPALGLNALLGRPLREGRFAGQITYRQPEGARWTLTAGGALHGADLAELTERIIGGPFEGRVDVTLSEAVFAPVTDLQVRLRSLMFHGSLKSLQLAQFATALRAPDLDGHMDLFVQQAHYRHRQIKHLRVSGTAEGVSLEALTRLLGYGTVSGRLQVRINGLTIEDDRLRWADVDLIAVPPESGQAFIEKSALAALAKEFLGMEVESLLPERVEYVRLGVKLLLDTEGLRIRGTHGEDHRTILTIKLFGREVGILKQPDRVFPVGDLIERTRTRMAGYDLHQLVDWWVRRNQAEEPEAGAED